MHERQRPARRRDERGVTPIIATILLVAITVVGASLLYEIHLRTPPAPTVINYELRGSESEPVYGDGTDCTTTGGPNGVQNCQTMDAISVIFTGTSPSGLLLSALTFTVRCNGTVYLTATFNSMEWIPGTNGDPSSSAPQLGQCGSYTPPRASFNRLVYFLQVVPGATTLNPGDQLVIFMNTPGSWTQTDEDYHGIPGWCFLNASSCPMTFSYSGQGAASSGVVTTVNYIALYPA